MSKKIFLSLLLFSSSFILSSCTQTDQLKSKVLDKATEVQNQVNQKNDQKIIDEKSELTDEQLLKELTNGVSTIDSDIKSLETELR